MTAAASELVKKINSLDPTIFNIDYRDLENVKQIGGGNFGQVSKGTYFGTEVAIKQLLDVDDKDMHKYIEREMATLRDMRHPNVVQFMGLSRNLTDVYIVTEYIGGGDLRKILKDESKHLSWLLRAKIATDVAYAMTFLHSKGLIHRDLKSNNLLVGENWKVKVCDFGFSRRVNKGELMTLCGTDEWMAPEVMCGERYDEKADVFSFGMVLTELVTRKKPVLRKPATGFRFEPVPFRNSAPADCPPALIDLTILCSEQQPEKRPQFRDILPDLKNLVTELEAVEKAKPASESKSKEKKSSSSSSSGDKHHKKHHKSTKKTDTKNETPEEKAKRREARKKKKMEKAAKMGITVEQLEKMEKEKKKEKKEKA